MRYLIEFGGYTAGPKAVGAPIGSGNTGVSRPVKKWMPLSRFFMNMDDGGGDAEEKIMGFKEPKPKKTRKLRKSLKAKGSDRKAPGVPDDGESSGERSEGMTTSANIATVPVPIGPGIRHVSDVLDFAPGHPQRRKKRKKLKKDRGLGILLRRQNLVL